MAAAGPVLRIPRSDEKGSFILAHVTPTGPASRPLNVKLVATEGAAPYVLTLRHDRINRLRIKNCPCSEDEWEHILTSALLDKEPAEDVDAVASVEDESSLTITFRKRVQNITQRLGTLSLSYKEDESIELFDWCSEAIERRMQIREDLQKATAKAAELEAAVNELKGQLEEFIKAKDDDESALLEKFRDLLNEKKVKIREQQRIIASANLSVSHSDAEPAAQGRPKKTPARTSGPSRSSKRKATTVVSDDEEASDGASGKMDVDIKQEPQDDEQQQVSEDEETTDAGVTESEAEDDVHDEAAAVSKERSMRSKGRSSAATSSQTHKQKAASPAPEEAPPPKRNLPIGRVKAAKPSPPAEEPPAAGGSETESDDEL